MHKIFKTPGKSLPQILFPSFFFLKITRHPPPHTQTHKPAQKGEGTIKVYLNTDAILQGSFKTVKRSKNLLHKVINQQIRSLPFLKK